METLGVFDWIVIGILGISTLIAFFRGFVREVLSLAAWVIASVVTMQALPHTVELVKPHVSREIIAYGVAGVGTFMAVLLILSIINGVILRFLKEGANVGIVDNMLGLVFGAARGMLIVSLLYLPVTVMVETQGEDAPAWLAESYTAPLVGQGAEIVAAMMPQLAEDMETAREHLGSPSDASMLTIPKTQEDGETPEGEGYTDAMRESLNRLIDEDRAVSE